jgi:hypothetical protein
MQNPINPITTVLAFALALIALDVFKPQAARIVIGIFFLVMALGANLTIVLIDPHLYVLAGEHALLPVYRWFFTSVLAWNPVVFVIPLIGFETAVGALILSRGRWVRWGLLLGMLFCIAISPLGIEDLTGLALALALALLLRQRFDRSVVEMVSSRWAKKPRLQA